MNAECMKFLKDGSVLVKQTDKDSSDSMTTTIINNIIKNIKNNK
jgi:hypothetical protein